MELKEAIEILKDYADWTSMLRTQCPDCMGEAIKTVLKELDTLQMNYKLLEEKFDGSAEEKVDKLTEKLDRLNKRIEYALDFAVNYDGYYNPETKRGNAEGLAMTIDDMVDALKGNLKGVE